MFNHVNEFPDEFIPPLYSLAYQADRLHCLRVFERMIAASTLPHKEGQAEFIAIERKLKEEEKSVIQSWRHTVTHILISSTLAFREPVTRATANDRAAGTLVACELYRLSNGSYPTKLDQLVPFFLDSVPIDPFDGQPFRYQVKPEEIIVYSVGEDMIDDGGESREDHSYQNPDMSWRLKIVE